MYHLRLCRDFAELGETPDEREEDCTMPNFRLPYLLSSAQIDADPVPISALPSWPRRVARKLVVTPLLGRALQKDAEAQLMCRARAKCRA